MVALQVYLVGKRKKNMLNISITTDQVIEEDMRDYLEQFLTLMILLRALMHTIHYRKMKK